MPKAEHIIKVAGEWISKAENDLKNAVHTLKMADDCPTDTVCYHAQQCIEKYLKVILVWKGVPFPKTHNLKTLVSLLPTTLQKIIIEEEQDMLTEYATVTRYPGDYEDISLSEAKASVRIARRVRKDIRALLPREVLRFKRNKVQHMTPSRL